MVQVPTGWFPHFFFTRTRRECPLQGNPFSTYDLVPLNDLPPFPCWSAESLTRERPSLPVTLFNFVDRSFPRLIFLSILSERAVFIGRGGRRFCLQLFSFFFPPGVTDKIPRAAMIRPAV